MLVIDRRAGPAGIDEEILGMTADNGLNAAADFVVREALAAIPVAPDWLAATGRQASKHEPQPSSIRVGEDGA